MRTSQYNKKNEYKVYYTSRPSPVPNLVEIIVTACIELDCIDILDYGKRRNDRNDKDFEIIGN